VPKLPRKSVFVIIPDETENQVLLIKREDFRIWALPAGAVEPGEDWATAAIREAREETGLQVELTALVGKYTRPRFGDEAHVYSARPVGGSLEDHGWEAVDVRFFPLDALPRSFSRLHREFLADWQAGEHPVEREQHVPWWFALLLSTMIPLRNLRNRMKGLP